MTIGDYERRIKKDSLINEIKRLEGIVRETLNSDGEASVLDPEIQAYKNLIAAKKAELERL